MSKNFIFSITFPLVLQHLIIPGTGNFAKSLYFFLSSTVVLALVGVQKYQLLVKKSAAICSFVSIMGPWSVSFLIRVCSHCTGFVAGRK
jgi:hypothetical protein